MNMKFNFKTALLVASLGLASVSLTACGTPTVNLNDYVVVTDEGYEGYGKVSAYIDTDKILEDYRKRLTKNLDSSIFGDQTPELAFEFAFDYYDPYALAYNKPENAKNGDKISFSWNTSNAGIQRIKKILDVDFKYKNFDYKISNLKPIKVIDPFEDVYVEGYGASGKGTVSYAYAFIDLGDKVEKKSLKIIGDKNNRSNGEFITVDLNLSDSEAERYVRDYGIKFERTQGEALLDMFSYTPTNREVFECMRDDNTQNVLDFIKDWQNKTDKAPGHENREVSLAGVCYYFDKRANSGEYSFNNKSQIVLILHIEDGIVPGGWYTYYAPNNDTEIHYDREYNEEMQRDILHKMTVLNSGEYSNSDFYNKVEGYDVNSYFRKDVTGQTFTYNENTYIGHRTVGDTVQAFEAKYNPSKHFDHMLVSGEVDSAFEY